jgi:hypothetical protein
MTKNKNALSQGFYFLFTRYGFRRVRTDIKLQAKGKRELSVLCEVRNCDPP